MKKLTAILLVLAIALTCVYAKGAQEAAQQAAAQEPATYTWNGSAATFPTNWNPHIYETATDNDILDYMQCGFYTFDYNEDETGYAVVPLMATEEPIDVTSQYIGQYGLDEESKNQAYIIKIRKDIKWDDGTPINAYDFVESQKRLINPKAQNYRADNLYSGNMVIYNAKNYLYQGQSVLQDNGTGAFYAKADLTLGADGQYYTPNNEPVYIGLAYSLAWTSGNTLADYANYYGDAYFDMTNWDALIAMADEDGLIPLTDENYALFVPVTTGNPNWGETEDDVPNYFVYNATYPELDWSEVGYQALSDYEILIVLTKPLKGFYLLYALTGSDLVKLDPGVTGAPDSLFQALHGDLCKGLSPVSLLIEAEHDVAGRGGPDLELRLSVPEDD